jgi:hypothetical protein
MSNVIRKWAGPRFVEKPGPLTAEEIKWAQIKKENFEAAVKAALCLSGAAVCGLVSLAIGNFSPVAFLAVAIIAVISTISSLA